MSGVAQLPIEDRLRIGQRNADCARDVLGKYFVALCGKSNNVSIKTSAVGSRRDSEDKVDFDVIFRNGWSHPLKVGLRCRPNYHEYYDHDMTVHLTELKALTSDSGLDYFLYCKQDGEDGQLLAYKILDVRAWRSAVKGYEAKHGHPWKPFIKSYDQRGKENSFLVLEYRDFDGFLVEAGKMLAGGLTQKESIAVPVQAESMWNQLQRRGWVSHL